MPGALVISGLLWPVWFGCLKAQPTTAPPLGDVSLGPESSLPNVVTQHGDNLRSGAQLLETVLTTSSVRASNFAKLATRRVFGQIYAQPLYVQNVDVRGVGRRNVVYVATMKNWVYAFDADDTSANADPLWKLQLPPPFDLNSVGEFHSCKDISSQIDKRIIGITSTPVIDLARSTMFLVAKTGLAKTGLLGWLPGPFVLVAVDIRNGAILNAKVIEGEVLGTGIGSVRLSPNNPRDHRSVIRFRAEYQHQRPALLLSNGVLYIAFGSYCDKGPFHGWLFAYDADKLEQRGVFNTTPILAPPHCLGDTPNTTKSTPFVTADGWVYFQSTDNKLCKVWNDGSQLTEIGDTKSTPFVTADGWVYFQRTDNKLCKVWNDGSQLTEIGDTKSTPFVTADGWVYFQSTDHDKLCKVWNDGSQLTQIGHNKTKSTPFVTADGWVYFQGTDEGILRRTRLWKVRGDSAGTGLTQIGHNTTKSTPFVTADGWVYFQGTDDRLLKVRGDSAGSDLTVVGFRGVAEYVGERGGIWQAGQGPAADGGGNVYFMTGNGGWDGRENFGDSFVKLAPPAEHGLGIASYFTPYDQALLDCGDQDLGSAGVLLVPGTDALLGGGKPGTLYLLDRTNLGGIAPNDNQIVEKRPGATLGHIHGSPVFWNSPTGPRVYVWAEHDQLKSFGLRIRHRISPVTLTPITQTHFDGSPPQMSNLPKEELTKPDVKDGKEGDAMPGGFLTISANGSTPGSGIVWANYPKTNANEKTAEGILYAFNAETLEKLWSSDDFRFEVDNKLGIFANFVAPTVANGKVYMAAWSENDPDGRAGRLHIYGILPCPDPVSGCVLIP